MNYKLNYLFCKISEQPCRVLLPLANVEIMEKETLSLNVKLSKPRQVQWMHGDESLTDELDRIKLSVSDNQLEHSLAIVDASVKENGTFVARIDDRGYGFITSACSVTIKG